jgi:hypothetical protein
VANEKRSLVESLATHPTRHFIVALTGVARTTRRHDVVERVATAARQRQNTIALQGLVGHAAIGTATPLVLERRPLSNAEVIVNVVHPTLAFTSRSRLPTSIDGHQLILRPTCLSKVLQRGNDAIRSEFVKEIREARIRRLVIEEAHRATLRHVRERFDLATEISVSMPPRCQL